MEPAHGLCQDVDFFVAAYIGACGDVRGKDASYQGDAWRTPIMYISERDEAW